MYRATYTAFRKPTNMEDRSSGVLERLKGISRMVATIGSAHQFEVGDSGVVGVVHFPPNDDLMILEIWKRTVFRRFEPRSISDIVKDFGFHPSPLYGYAWGLYESPYRKQGTNPPVVVKEIYRMG